MSYFEPYIDESGYHYPEYNDIIEQLVMDAQSIFGSGIYLGSDSQDYQLLSKLAEKIFDTYQTCEIVYHSHSPVSAIGACLDYIVAVNGIARKQGTRSTVDVTLTGTPNTVITNGAIADKNGFMWDLPETVVIGDSGQENVEAVCREVGVVRAEPNTITRIMTPTLGWSSVTNSSSATTGTITETDSELRARQAISVAQPSQSMMQGLRGAIASIVDVARSTVYENDTDVTDKNGIPSHSICAVIEGGNDEEIARTILFRKTIGCGTYGKETVTIYDRDQPYEIRFSHPEYVDVDIEITITKRDGYAASIPDEITNAVVSYLNTFFIGTDLTTSIIWMIAQQINADYRTPAFSISSVKAARHGEPVGVEDIVIAFDEVARGNASYVTVKVS